MFATPELCSARVKISSREEFERAFDVHRDLASLVQDVRQHFARSPPVVHSKRKTAAATTTFPAIATIMSSPVYRDVDVESVVNTLTYLFDRHKLGIYVSIRGNRVARFATFVNPKYRNPLAKMMRLAPPAADVGPLNRDSRRWLNFDCIVSGIVNTRQEASPGYEPGHSHAEVRTCLERTCAARTVRDCDFFFNLQDQLVLRADLCVPHLSITGGRLVPIASLDPKSTKMAPVVSLCYADGYLDLPFVFPDDVQRVSGGAFSPRCTSPFAAQAEFVTDWSRKKHAMAVFRGTATGCGWTTATNPRLALALASSLDRENLLDVKLTGTHNPRFKKHESDSALRFVTDPLLVSLQSDEHRLTLVQQSEYKYVLDLPGNVVAYRLAGMFGLGSVMIVVVHPRYRPWIWPLLEHRVNCMLLRRADDVPAVVRWLRAHDHEARRIAQRGLELFRTAFAAEAMLDYTALLVNSIASTTAAAAAAAAAAAKVKTAPPSKGHKGPSGGPGGSNRTEKIAKTLQRMVEDAMSSQSLSRLLGSPA